MQTFTVYLTYFDCSDVTRGRTKPGWYMRSFTEKNVWHGPYFNCEIKRLQMENDVVCQFENTSGVCYIEEVIANANYLLA